MEKIKVTNADGKLVCCVDKETRIVEIVRKGCKTLIQLIPNGEVKIINTKS